MDDIDAKLAAIDATIRQAEAEHRALVEVKARQWDLEQKARELHDREIYLNAWQEWLRRQTPVEVWERINRGNGPYRFFMEENQKQVRYDEMERLARERTPEMKIDQKTAREILRTISGYNLT